LPQRQRRPKGGQHLRLRDTCRDGRVLNSPEELHVPGKRTTHQQAKLLHEPPLNPHPPEPPPRRPVSSHSLGARILTEPRQSADSRRRARRISAAMVTKAAETVTRQCLQGKSWRTADPKHGYSACDRASSALAYPIEPLSVVRHFLQFARSRKPEGRSRCLLRDW
jgi:hypothetical protein